MNNKGVEGVPFSFLVSLLVLVLVFAGGFYLVESFNSFNSDSSFLNSISQIKEDINFLKTGDSGSFSTVSVSIPTGSFLVFEGSNIKFNNYSISVNALFDERVEVESGSHDLVLCYGSCERVSNLVEFE